MSTKPRARITHELKTWPEFFEQTRNGRKKFELRRNDRDFQVGDELLLKEWDPVPRLLLCSDDSTRLVHYTGRELLVRVDYIMDTDTIMSVTVPPEMRDRALPGIGYVIMSISHVN